MPSISQRITSEPLPGFRPLPAPTPAPPSAPGNNPADQLGPGGNIAPLRGTLPVEMNSDVYASRFFPDQAAFSRALPRANVLNQNSALQGQTTLVQNVNINQPSGYLSNMNSDGTLTAAGLSFWSLGEDPTTPPLPPINLMQTSTSGMGWITMAWSAPANALNPATLVYEVQTDTSPSFDSPNLIDLINLNVPTAQILKPDSTLYWRVRAKFPTTDWGAWAVYGQSTNTGNTIDPIAYGGSYNSATGLASGINVTGNGAWWNWNDIRSGGFTSSFGSGVSGVGFWNLLNSTAEMLYLSTSSMGVLGTPAGGPIGFQLFQEINQVTWSNLPQFKSNNTAIGGVDTAFYSDQTNGALKLWRNGADTLINPSSSQVGLFGSPTSALSIFGNGSGIIMSGSGIENFNATDTSAGGIRSEIGSGYPGAGYGYTAVNGGGNVSRYTSSLFGFYGTPTVPMQLFAGQSYLTNPSTISLYLNNTAMPHSVGFEGDNDTNTLNLVRVGIARDFGINSSGQAGLAGIATTIFEAFGGTSPRPIINGTQPYWQMQDTATSGVSTYFGTGLSAPGYGSIYQNIDILRFSSLSEVGIAGTPTSSLSISGVDVFVSSQLASPANLMTFIPPIVSSTTGFMTGLYNGTSGQININANTWYTGDLTINYNSGTITGLSAGTTISYTVYVDDPTLAGGSVTYKTVVVLKDLVQPGRLLLGNVAVPTSGDATGGGSSGKYTY